MELKRVKDCMGKEFIAYVETRNGFTVQVDKVIADLVGPQKMIDDEFKHAFPEQAKD